MLIFFGDIKVFVVVLIEEWVLLFKIGLGEGWVMVEYVMLLCVMYMWN